MAVYTVHEPPPRRYETEADPERFTFVRDGFSFWAFLLGPLWMIWHRMWLVLLGYVVTIAALTGLVRLLNLSDLVAFTIALLLALLIGFEAATLRRFTLARRHWHNVGVIVGDDVELAERRFFDARARQVPLASAAVPPPSFGQIGAPGTAR
jgi:hypothetical protein